MKLLIGSKKLILPIALALSFIFSTLISVCIILDSHNVVTINNTTIRISISQQMKPSSSPVEAFDKISSDLYTIFSEFDLQGYINSSWIDPNMNIGLVNITGKEYPGNHDLRNSYGGYGRLFYFEEEKIDLLTQLMNSGSRFPQNPGEIILVVPEQYQTSFQINSSVNCSANVQLTNLSFPLKIVGILPLWQEEGYSFSYEFRESNFQYLNQIRGKLGMNVGESWFSILTQKADLSAIWEKLIRSIGGDTSEQYPEVDFFFNIDGYILKSHESQSLLELLDEFSVKISESYISASVLTYDIKNEIQNIGSKWYSLFAKFILMALPLLTIAFLFTKYTVKSTLNYRMDRLQILQTRGISFNQIILLLIGEIGIILALSNLVGFVFGFLISGLLISIMKVAPQLIIEPANWGTYLIIFNGICITLIYGGIIAKIIKFHNSKEFRGLRGEKNSSSIHPWAIKLLIIGIILFCVSFVFDQFFDQGFFTLDQSIREIIAISAMLFVLIGLIFSLTTVYYKLIHTLSKRMWKKYSKNVSLTLAFNHLKRYSRNTSEVWLFISLLIGYSFCLVSYEASMETYYHHQGKFEVGADYSIEFHPSEEEAITSYLRENISSITSFTKVTYARAKVMNVRLNILGIDPSTFFDVGYSHPQFGLAASLESLQQSLTQNKYAMWVSEGFLHSKEITIGNTFHLTLKFRDFSVNGPSVYFYYPIGEVSVESSFKMFPLIAESSIYFDNNQAIIMHQDFLKELEQTAPDTLQHLILVNVNSMIPPDIIQELVENYHVEIKNRIDISESLKAQQSWDQFIIVKQVNIAISLALVAGVLLLFGIFQLERRTHEHAIERALGVKRQELTRSVLFEDFFILTSSIISGVATGSLFALVFLHNQNIYFYENFGKGIFPEINLPFVQFFPYFVWFAISMLLSILPSQWLQQKYDVGELLKQI